MNIAGFTVFLLTAVNAACQPVDFNDYALLRSGGTLPVQFETSTREKLTKLTKDGKKNGDADFIIESSYSLDRFLSSGKVLFNTPLNTYVTGILRAIFTANGIDEDMEVYIVQTNDANAYAGNENIIFVTTGMIAQAETEAELAFILCHEYIHYSRRHILSTYLKEKEIVADYRKYKRGGQDYKERKAFYSRKLEEEADMEGLRLFLKTNYSLEAAQSTFEVLRYADLPFSMAPFPKTFFETEFMIFPKEFFLDTLAPVSDRSMDRYSDKDESLNSHPALSDRKEKVAEMIAGISNEGRLDFMAPAADFYTMRKMARFETIRLDLLDRSYEKALYNAFILMQDDPQSLYLQRSVVKAVYGLATYSNRKKLARVHRNPKNLEGDMQQVAHLIHSMSRIQLNYFALQYAWTVHKRFPGDAEVAAICDDLFRQSKAYHKMSESFFMTEMPVANPDSVKQSDLLVSDTAKVKTKYSQIKKSGTSGGSQKINSDIGFIRYAFVGFMKDVDFRSKVREAIRISEEESVPDEDLQLKGRNKGRLQLEEAVNSGNTVSDVLFFDPIVIKLDLRKKNRKFYASTEEQKDRFIEYIRFSGKKAGVETRVLSRSGLDENDVETLNDISIVSSFISERMDHENVRILPSDQADLKRICQKHDVSNIGYIGMLSYVEAPRLVNIIFLLTPALPYAIYKLAVPKKHTVFYIGVYSLITNEVAFSDAVDVSAAASQDVVLGQLYDLLLRLRNNDK